jgi:hypothetical protein
MTSGPLGSSLLTDYLPRSLNTGMTSTERLLLASMPWPAASAKNQLTTLSAIIATDIWTPCDVQKSSSGYQMLIEDGNEERWKLVLNQSQWFRKDDPLTVTATSPDTVRAAGDAPAGGNPLPMGSLLEHWDGQNWQATTIPPALTIVNMSPIPPQISGRSAMGGLRKGRSRPRWLG